MPTDNFCMDSGSALFTSRYHSHWDGALHPVICRQPVSGLVSGLMTYDDLVCTTMERQFSGPKTRLRWEGGTRLVSQSLWFYNIPAHNSALMIYCSLHLQQKVNTHIHRSTE
jgi:hypothetical protein